MKIIGALILLTMLKVCVSDVIDNTEADVKEILDYLHKIDEKIEISRPGETILVLGPTGSGKSTLVHLLAGNLSLLRSIEIEEYSDDYIIEYVSEDKIGNFTSGSKIIYPDLIIDENNVPYYDFPGFSDTRKTSMEIATTYFTKKVLKYAAKLKIVFVVDYHTMMKGIGSRNDFSRFIKHATEFLKNVKHYSDGIILVASKAPVLQGPDGVDEKLINKMRVFLKKYRQYILEEAEQNSSQVMSNELNLIDIFLSNERITLFKRTASAGLLSDIPQTMQNRQELLNSIHQKIQFVQVNGDDFGYTLSDQSKLKITDLAEEINRTITSIFDQIDQRVIDHYSNGYGNYNNIEKLQLEFDNAIKILSKVTVNISMSEYLAAVNKLNIPTLQENLVDIKNHKNYLKFLQTVHNKLIIRRTSEWRQSLKNSLEYLNNENIWCVFAKQLFHRLSEFDVQSNTSKYDVEDVERWSLGDNKKSNNGILITHENFSNFLAKLLNSRLVDNTKPSKSKIELLNNILNITLKSKPITSCFGNKLIARGTFVKFSDVNRYRAHCNNTVRFIEVFATSTIFLDMDFKGNVDLVVIAPKWYVAKTHIQINLDGIEGTDYTRVKDRDGKPGMPGQNANNFFGYGDDVVNRENLYISAVGGNGGRGQDGLKGHDGKEIIIPVDGNDGRHLEGNTKLMSRSNYDDIGFLYFNRKYWVYETFHSSVNCPGINGIGGSGGYGGQGGTIELNGMSGVKMVTRNGHVGAHGKPGQCGMMYNQVEMQKSRRKACSFWFFCKNKVTWKNRIFSDTTCVKKCRDSTQVNMIGIPHPIPTVRLNAAFSVNQYKSFVRENLDIMPVNRKQVQNFLRSIEENSKIKSIYDTKTFIDDFYQIEQQIHVLKKENNLSDLYQSLLERILEYATNRSDDLQVNERRTLANLYTAGLSRLCKLRSGTEQSLIIDIESYLDVAIDHIRLFEKTAKQLVVNQLQNEYRQNLEMKMNDTRSIIVMDILPEIEKLNLRIDSNFENLLDEVLEAKNSVAINTDRYKQAKRELQGSVMFRGIFKFVKMVAGITSFFDGFARIVSTTIKTMNQVAEAFSGHRNNRRTAENPHFESSDEFKNNHFQLENSVRHTKQRKWGFLLDIIDDILTVATGFSFDDILEPIRKAKNILNGETKVDLTSEEIDLLQANVGNILRNKTHEVKQRNETESLQALKKIIQNLSVLEIDVDLFSKFSSDDHKLHEIEGAMKQSKKHLLELKILERQFLQSVDPVVKYLKSLFSQFPKQLKDQKMPSEVMKWRIQKTLKELRFRMQQVRSDKLEYELLHTIEKLDGAISTLLNIFDRMQIYEDQVKLGNYIANIESVDYSIGRDSSNQELDNLKAIIQSNVILTIFDNAVNGFKQTVFPFAGFYLLRFDSPHQLKMDTNLKTLVKAASEELVNLKLTLKEYRSASINDNDNIIHTADFTSSFKSSTPFYVWSGKEHNEIIEKLLSGQAVTIKSDITKGVKWNAVKFQYIEIHLKSSDQTKQANLDRFLKYFDVTIIHHGNSYYRCDNKFYLITSPVQHIEYSFEKGVNGVPIRRNNVYNKMKNGDFTLSPYALLTISLTDRKPDIFKSLDSDLIRTVHLELVGRGKYLNPNIDACRGLEKYYAADEIVNDFHGVNNFT